MSDRQIKPVAKMLMTGKARITNRENWCTHAFRDDHKRCAVGALMADEVLNSPMPIEARMTPYRDAINALKESCRELYGTCNIYGVNDAVGMGYEYVMKVYDHAISRAIMEKNLAEKATGVDG